MYIKNTKQSTKCSQWFKRQPWIFKQMWERCHLLPAISFWFTGLLFSTWNSNHLLSTAACFSVCAKQIISEAGSFFVCVFCCLRSHLSQFSWRFSGSPAELCQLCVDDEIVAVDGVAVAHMSYNQWEDKMTSALQIGSLTMDIRRYGNKGKLMNPKRQLFLSPPSEVIYCLQSINH